MVYQFWAVGQGLFSSGQIQGGNCQFNWVYDCGSTVTAIAEQAVDNFDTCLGKTKEIDLLAISHFDKDHISGLPKLLSKYKVKYWLLPYYPLWQRILIALSQNISPESEYFAFYIDPINAILEFTQQEEAHFLFVPVYQENKEYDPIFQHRDREDALQYATIPNKNTERLTLGELNQWKNQQNIQVEFLTHQPLQFNGVEFVPYNMPLPPLKMIGNTVQDLQDEVSQLISNAQLDKKVLKKKLIETYNKYFGKDAKNKNMISLFLYIGSSHYQTYHFEQFTFYSVDCCNGHNLTCLWSPKSAVLYTGDGYLDTLFAFQQLKAGIGEQRMANIFCLQVPHHGSEHNWYKGLADDIQPVVSIFSANPNKRPHHPSALVLRDFAPYIPIIINQPKSALSIFHKR